MVNPEKQDAIRVLFIKYMRFFRWYLKWPIITALWLFAFYLGFTGFAKQADISGMSRSFWDLFYLSLQLFTLQSGATLGAKTWELEVARLLAPSVAAYTLWQALAVIFYNRLQMLRLRFLQHHTVLCGLGRKGFLLTKNFLEHQEQVVIIEQDENNNFIHTAKDLGAIILIGNAADKELLSRAKVDKAKYLILVCGNDGINAEVAIKARELMEEGGQAQILSCFAHIVDPKLCSLLKEREVMREKPDFFRLEFFNIFDSAARTLLKKQPPFDEERISQGRLPHILIIGLGRLGESFLSHLGREWREGYFSQKGRLRVTIVDREAIRKTEMFFLKHPQLKELCELDAQEIDVSWPEFERAKFLYGPNGECVITSAYVCFDNDELGLAVGLTLFGKLREKNVPVAVRMTYDAGLAMLLKEKKRDATEGILAFGLLDYACKLDLLLGGTYEVLARAIHEDYCLEQKITAQASKSDSYVLSWEELPEYLKEANRRQADHIGTKLKAVRCAIRPLSNWALGQFEFSPQEIELLAKMEHTRWTGNLLSGGWTYAAGKKDPERKTHPDLVSWEELSAEIQEIDRNAVRNLPKFLSRAGFEIYRLNK